MSIYYIESCNFKKKYKFFKKMFKEKILGYKYCTTEVL